MHGPLLGGCPALGVSERLSWVSALEGCPLLLSRRFSMAVRSCGHWFRNLGHALPHLQDLLLSCPSIARSPPRWGFQG